MEWPFSGENFVLPAEIPCEWVFATKFVSDCECDGLVHSGVGCNVWSPNPKFVFIVWNPKT